MARLASCSGADITRLMAQHTVGSIIRVSFMFLDDVAGLAPLSRPISDRLAFSGRCKSRHSRRMNDVHQTSRAEMTGGVDSMETTDVASENHC